MTDHNTAIEFEHVSKSFGEKQVLRDVSFAVDRGEAVCILGRSGTGKSVLLKLMIALLKPETGHIRICDREITTLDEQGLSEVRRKVGFLFQGSALFDSLTLHDNVAFPLRRLTNQPEKQIQETTERILAQVGLENDKHKLPVELSGGMKKRAGLARALVLEPEILLIDEPSSGLDRITAAEIDDLLLEAKQIRHNTMVIVTHDAHGARRIGDRIAVLAQGKLAAIGRPTELENHNDQTIRRLVAEQ